jgi:sulfur carrier protein
VSTGDALLVNGEHRKLPAGSTVEDVVALVAPSSRGVAVALNGDVVPRSAWGVTALAAGDQVEVLTAAQGG